MGIKVGIVGSDSITSELIFQSLVLFGYAPTKPATTVELSLNMLIENNPDIVLIDVSMEDGLMGANIARKVEELNIPFIFTTSDIGMESVQLFKKLSPSSYLTKPIKPEDLYAAIEICLRNHGGTVEKKFTTIFKKVSSEYFFVRINQHLHRVSVVDITHLESKANYVQLFTGSGPLMVRNTLPGVLQAINYAKIVRVHKSFAVNIDKITMLRQDAISIGDITVPLGKTYRDQLHEHLRFI